MPGTPLLVVTLNTWELPHIERDSFPRSPCLLRSLVVVSARSIRRHEYRVGVPSPVLGVAGEIEDVGMAGDELAVIALAEPEMPYAPVDHRKAEVLEIDYGFRCQGVRDVDPH